MGVARRFVRGVQLSLQISNFLFGVGDFLLLRRDLIFLAGQRSAARLIRGIFGLAIVRLLIERVFALKQIEIDL